MCEFCNEHSEGRKWYLEMEHYSEALLHEELAAPENEIAGVKTRVEWMDSFLKNFVLPATGSFSKLEPDARSQDSSEPPQLTPDEILRRRKIVHFGQVLPLEDVEKVIDIVDSITRWPCGCRYVTTGMANMRYCFGFGIDTMGILGSYPDAASSLEVLEKDDAKQLFRKYDEEGLFHSIWTGVTPYIIGLCNCDRDCGSFRQSIENAGSPTFFRAEYICQVDWDVCNGCKNCMSQCQFGAQFYSSALGKVFISAERCYGCGVCRSACPVDAIALIPRREHAVANIHW